MSEHTVRSYDDELGIVTNAIVRMGALAEAQFAAALDALVQRDDALAGRVIAADARIDDLEREVQHMAVRLLALRQPMASDLRLIVASVKIASALERVGDYAANVAKRSLVINTLPPVGAAVAVRELGRLVGELLRGVLDAFARQDVVLAVENWKRDREVDERYTAMVENLNAIMVDDPRTIGACIHYLFIAKNIERIGDHATNIAESLYFLIKGQPLTETRPKGGGEE